VKPVAANAAKAQRGRSAIKEMAHRILALETASAPTEKARTRWDEQIYVSSLVPRTQLLLRLFETLT
jgi:hypothetical protein